MGVKEVLDNFKEGRISAEDAERMLRMDYLDTIGDDVVFDTSRQLRKNIPEIVYGLSKTPETVARIAAASRSDVLLISKASKEHFDEVKKTRSDSYYDERARMIVVGRMPAKTDAVIAIVTAGNSDIPVAEEARLVASSMGVQCLTYYDIGVAGLHRLIGPMKDMIASDVSAIVAVAGMEGALPTVVSSLSPVPVIGVPTSTGYGMGGKGETALLSMLQSCSAGLTVVNIDNGVGAGTTAAMIALGRNRR